MTTKTLHAALQTSDFGNLGEVTRDQLFAMALLWIIEHQHGAGYCWELRDALRRIAFTEP